MEARRVSEGKGGPDPRLRVGLPGGQFPGSLGQDEANRQLTERHGVRSLHLPSV